MPEVYYSYDERGQRVSTDDPSDADFIAAVSFGPVFIRRELSDWPHVSVELAGAIRVGGDGGQYFEARLS